MNIAFNANTLNNTFSINRNTKSSILGNLAPLNRDTVSFGAKKKKEPPVITQNMKNAMEFGLNLYGTIHDGSLSYNKIEKEAQKYIPIIKIDNVENLPDEFKSKGLIVNAYLSPKYNENGVLDEITMYIPEKTEDALQCSKVVHEFTHALQRYNDDTYIGAFTLLGERNINHARGLNGIATQIFQIYETLKAVPMLKKASKMVNKGKAPQTAIAEAYGYKNAEDFKRNLAECFDELYPKILNEVKKEKENIPFIPFLDNPDKLKQCTKAMCQKHAQMEQEAYKAQELFIKKTDKRSLTDENKMSPVYYKILADALS